MDFPIDGLHFYSETFDLTKSLAFRDSRSSGASTRPEESEWVWNQPRVSEIFQKKKKHSKISFKTFTRAKNDGAGASLSCIVSMSSSLSLPLTLFSISSHRRARKFPAFSFSLSLFCAATLSKKTVWV